MNAKPTTAKAQVNQFRIAVEQFKLENGKFPDTLHDLMNPPADAKKRESFMDQIPKDPWGHDYVYRRYSGNPPFEILSYGADGVPGGEGKDGDISSHQNMGSK